MYDRKMEIIQCSFASYNQWREFNMRQTDYRDQFAFYQHSLPVIRQRKYFFRLFVAVAVLSILTLFTTAFAAGSISSAYSTESFKDFLDSLNNSEMVYFNYGSAELNADSYAALDKIADMMNGNDNLNIVLTGYTDNRGGDEFNLGLSIKRAESVKQYLVSKGINENRITANGKGENEPVNGNADDNERMMNRRVEFTLSGYNNSGKAPNNSSLLPIDDLTVPVFQYVNSSLTAKNRDELNADITVRDEHGNPFDSLNENDISAQLKWELNGKTDSTEGQPRLIPINDKKKLAITLTMDYSGSMYGDDNSNINTPKSNNILQMEKSVEQFIKQMNNKMYCKIIKFGSTVNVTSRFTASKEVLQRSLEGNTFPMGGTALYQSIYTALSDTTYQSNPTVMKTVIAFTDGMENASKNITIDSVYNKCLLTNTKIFTVGLFDRSGTFIPTEYEIAKGKSDLYNIAQRSGGFFYSALSANMLSAIYDNIFKQVLNSYNVSIVWNSSKLPPKGTQVKAELKVNVLGKIRTFYKSYIIE